MRATRQAAAILACALVAGSVSALIHPRRPPWFELGDPAAERWRLPVAEARRLADSGGVVWIDARKRSDYEAGHLPGALLLNAEEWAELMFEHQVALQDAFDRPVIVYCDGKACALSAEIATRLRELLGLDPVYVLEGDWREITDPRS